MTLDTGLTMSGFTGMDNIGGMGAMGTMGTMGLGGMGMGIGSQHHILYQLQSILQLQLFKNFSTGNFFIDTLTQLFLMTLITYLFTQVKTLLDKTGLTISWLGYKTWIGSRWVYCKILNTPIKQITTIKRNIQ